jgi:hypothetical protein
MVSGKISSSCLVFGVNFAVGGFFGFFSFVVVQVFLLKLLLYPLILSTTTNRRKRLHFDFSDWLGLLLLACQFRKQQSRFGNSYLGIN